MVRILLALALLATAAAAETTVEALSIAAGDKTVKAALPAGWKTVSKDSRITIVTDTHSPHIQVWQAKTATIAEAEAAAAKLVVDEVKDFAVAKAEDVTVAGAKARRLVGTGTEADDGDPSNAEVTLFALGGKVFLLVSHGEGDGAAKRREAIAGILAGLK